MSPSRRAFLVGAGALAAASAVRGLRAASLAPPPSAAPGFAPPIGACRGSGDADLFRAGGADYLEISCSGELQPLKPEREVAAALEKLRAASLPIRAANGFLPGSLRATGPDADHEAILAYARTAFARAAAVGIRTITFGSAGARQLPKDFPVTDAELQFAALLARLAGPAQEAGIVVAVEPLQQAECNFLNRLEQARRVVAAVRHPAIRLTADVFHMAREEEGAEAIRAAGSLVHHVHLAEKRTRTAPGVDGDDFVPYLQALKDAGFGGLISLECGWGDPARELPGALQALRGQCARVA